LKHQCFGAFSIFILPHFYCDFVAEK